MGIRRRVSLRGFAFLPALVATACSLYIPDTPQGTDDAGATTGSTEGSTTGSKTGGETEEGTSPAVPSTAVPSTAGTSTAGTSPAGSPRAGDATVGSSAGDGGGDDGGTDGDATGSTTSGTTTSGCTTSGSTTGGDGGATSGGSDGGEKGDASPAGDADAGTPAGSPPPVPSCGEGEAPDPRVSDVVVDVKNPNRAVVRWKTSVPTTTKLTVDLDYVEPENQTSVARKMFDETLTTEHEVDVEQLTSDLTHAYRIGGAPATGAAIADRRRCLKTPAFPALALPDGWIAQDMNRAPFVLGSTTFVAPPAGDDPGAGVFVAKGAGLNIFYDEDTFHFVHRPVDKDFTLTVRVDSFHGFLSVVSKAFTMFRANLSLGSPFVNSSLNYAFADYFYQRTAQDEDLTSVDEGSKFLIARHDVGAGGSWLRLQRVVAASGTSATFTQSYSYDGVTWHAFGKRVASEPGLVGPGHVGFGTCSKSNQDLLEVHYSHVSLTVP